MIFRIGGGHCDGEEGFYRWDQRLRSPNALPSCVTDAETFADLVKTKFGFQVVGQLTDRAASKANIIEGLQRLIANPGQDDQFVFYYSGHGYRQQVGDEYVESIVPQDADFLTCPELAAITAGVKPAALTIVFDSCHSGGMQKAFTLDRGVRPAKVKFFTVSAEEKDKDYNRALPAAKYTSFASETCPIEETRLVGPPTSTTKAFSIVDPQQAGKARNFILLSACQADETAAASTERTGGKSAFTFALLNQISGQELDVADLLNNTGKSLRALGLRQTPMLKVPDLPPQLAGCAFLYWNKPLPVSQSKDFSWLSLDECWPKTPGTILRQSNQATEKGFAMNTMSVSSTARDSIQLDKGWLDTIASTIKTVAPIAMAGLQAYSGSSKGFEASPQVDKAWFDTLTRTIGTVVPAVLQGMQSMQPPSKAFETAPVPFDKAWYDSITSVAAAVVPHIVEALKTSQQPNLKDLSAAAQKGWFDDVTSVVTSVMPVVIGAVQQSRTGAAQKGFQPAGVDDKGFWDTLGEVAKVAAPIALACI